jgi:ketosteroid isomerase-like protein
MVSAPGRARGRALSGLRRGAAVCLLLAAGSSPLVAQATADDSAAVVAVIAAFHASLARGDSLAVLGLLADDATILEAGGVEAKEDYRRHHLPADIAFAQAVHGERTAPIVTVAGEVAWAVSTSSSRGEFRGRAVDVTGAELMVLGCTRRGWRIRVIHWSSRSRSR